MAQVPCQVYANRSDIAGGSTLGHISQERVSALTVEIGAPLLAMHSATETGGARDTEYLARVFEMLYSVSLEKGRDGYIIK
jgi:aspartyl aminopeptidase